VSEYVYCPESVARQTLDTDFSELLSSLTTLVQTQFVSHRCMPLDKSEPKTNCFTNWYNARQVTIIDVRL